MVIRKNHTQRKNGGKPVSSFMVIRKNLAKLHCSFVYRPRQLVARLNSNLAIWLPFDEVWGAGMASGESTESRLPPVWPGFDSQTRCHMWVEFVGSLLCTERFSPGTPVSSLLKNQHLT